MSTEFYHSVNYRWVIKIFIILSTIFLDPALWAQSRGIELAPLPPEIDLSQLQKDIAGWPDSDCRGRLTNLAPEKFWVKDNDLFALLGFPAGVRAFLFRGQIERPNGGNLFLTYSMAIVQYAVLCISSDQQPEGRLVRFDINQTGRGYPEIPLFSEDEGKVQIEYVMVVAGGGVVPLTLTQAGNTELQWKKESVIHYALLGAVFAILLYNVFVWLGGGLRIYRLNVFYLLSMFTLNACLGLGYWFIHSSIETLGILAEPMLRVFYATGATAGTLAGFFVIIFAKHFLDLEKHKSFLIRLADGVAFLGVAFAAVTFSYFLITEDGYYFGPFSKFYGVLSTIVTVLLGVYAWLKMANPYAKVFLLAYSCLSAGTMIWVSMSDGHLEASMLTRNSLLVGSFCESIILSIGIGYRLRRAESHAHQQIAAYSEKLKTANEELQLKVEKKAGDMAVIMQEVDAAIFFLETQSDCGSVIGMEMSRHTQDHLPWIHPGAPAHTLWDEFKLPEEQRHLIGSIIVSAIGDDPFAFEANSANLPRLLESKSGRSFSLEMIPVMNKDNRTVERLLCMMKDQTAHLREKEELAAAEQRLRRIGALLAIGRMNGERCLQALQVLAKRVQSGYEDLANATTVASAGAALEEIIPNLHTIKGNARTVALAELSALAHNIESVAIGLRSSPQDGSSIEILGAQLARLYQAIEVVRKDAYDLGWGDRRYSTVPTEAFDFVASSGFFEPLRLKIAKGEDENGLLEKFLTPAFFRPLSLVPLIEEALLQVAKVVRKPVPEISMLAEGVWLKNEIRPFLEEMIPHIAANALDHGIESPEERRIAGKREQGLIEISYFDDGEGWLLIQFSDDGRGINPDLIGELALKKQVLTREALQSMDATKKAQLILKAGFSSKTEVSLVSGRGAGLTAVEEAARTLNGHLVARLGQRINSDRYRLILEVRINSQYLWGTERGVAIASKDGEPSEGPLMKQSAA